MTAYTLQADFKTGRYLLLKDNNTYVVSNILYDILDQYKENENIEGIPAYLNSKHGEQAYTPEFVSKALNLVFDQLEQKTSGPGLEDFLHAKITLIKEGDMLNIYQFLSVLFQKYIFYPLFAFSVIFTAYFFFYNDLLSVKAINNAFLDQLTLTNLLLSYLLFTLFIFIHELGHAAATTHFKLKPREIGFGFYFVFPVFYTNVSTIWQLNKTGRNVVNLGGIYFQLLINIILVGMFFQNDSAGLVFNLILANTFSMLFSLIPFFRYDGYWILSDSLNIPNLTVKARHQVIALLKSPSEVVKSLSKNGIHILIYSVLRVFFWVYVYYSVFRYMFFMTINLYAHIQQKFWLSDGKVILEFFVGGIGMLITMFFIFNHFRALGKFLWINVINRPRF